MDIFRYRTNGRAGLVLSFLMIVASEHVIAIDFQGLSEDDFLIGNVPVVLTGSRLIQERSEVPGSITVIDRAMIEATGTRKIYQLLRLVPGFQVGHTQNRVLTAYHGNSDEFSRRMQVLIDGRSIYIGITGGVEWNDIPLSVNDIERVEVFRGPNAVSYGSNAFVAVINIITRHPSTLQGIDGAIEAGKQGFRRGFVRKAGVHNDFSYRLSAEAWESDGELTIKDNKKRTSFNFFGEYRPNIQDTFEIMFGYLEGSNDIGSGSATNPFRNENILSHYQQIRWKRNVSADEEIKLQFYHNYHRVDDKYDVTIDTSGGEPFYPSSIPYIFSLSNGAHRYDIEYEHTKRINKALRLVWGAEARLNEVSGIHDFGIFNTDKIFKRRTYRAFIDSEWRVTPEFLISTGAMLENNSATGTDLSPRLALNYKIAPRQSVRFVASTATRIPAPIETDSNAALNVTVPGAFPPVPPLQFTDVFFHGNKDLDPERITSYEIGFYGEFFERRMSLDARLYREEIKDVVAFHEDKTAQDFMEDEPDVDTFANDGYQNITGWEVGLELKPTERTRLNLAVAYAKQEGEFRHKKNADGSLEYSESDKATPQYTSSALLIQKLDSQTEFSAGYYKVSNMQLFGGDETGGYSTVDLRLSRDFKAGSGKGRVEFVLQNAFGEYFDYAEGYVVEKGGFVSVSIDFD